MPIRGAKPKPIEQHRKAGTFRGDRHGTSLAVVEPVSVAPHEVTVAEAFAQVMADGVSWLARTDVPALSMLWSMMQEREPLRVDAMAGSTEARKHLRDLDKQLLGLLGDLGFNPAARARLGLAEVKAQSKLEELRERQAKR